MLIGTLVNVVLKLWRGDQGIVFFLGARWKCDLRRLSGASWVSTLICGRTRNPRTGAECSQSWSATGSTAPSPAGNPPPPTWNNQKSCLQATARPSVFRNHVDTFWSRSVSPCIFETHAGVLHPYRQVISHVNLKVVEGYHYLLFLEKPCLLGLFCLKLETRGTQLTGLGQGLVLWEWIKWGPLKERLSFKKTGKVGEIPTLKASRKICESEIVTHHQTPKLFLSYFLSFLLVYHLKCCLPSWDKLVASHLDPNNQWTWHASLSNLVTLTMLYVSCRSQIYIGLYQHNI